VGTPGDTVGAVQRSGTAPSGAPGSDASPFDASSGRATRSIAFAIAGFLACAVFAAAPGSPFQPVLPTGAEPSGPLTALATAIGLDRLAGSWLIAAGVVAAALAVVGFLALLQAAWRGSVSLRIVVWLSVAATIVVASLVPLLFSRDVYSYSFYGRIAAVYDENPYVRTPVEFAGDELWPLIGPRWVDTPAVYGPAFTTISSTIARTIATPAGQVRAYRWIAALASLATIALIAVTARRVRPERAAFAVAAFGLNPVILFHAVAGGHNDLLVAFALAAGFLLLIRDRPLPAVAVLAVGTLIKATLGLPLLLVLVWCIARTPTGQRVRTAATHVGLAVAIGVLFAAPYLQAHDPTLGMLELAGHEGWLAPSVFARKIFGWLSFGTLGWLGRVVFALVLGVTFVRLARDVARRAVDRAPLEDLGAAMGWSLVMLMLLGPVLLPWYVAWALPLVWLLPRPPRATLLAAAAALALAQWSTEPLRYPDAFDVNLFIGHWIVTPAMLVLALWCITDLRHLVLGRLPLHEPEPVPRERRQDRGEGGAPSTIERHAHPLEGERHDGQGRRAERRRRGSRRDAIVECPARPAGAHDREQGEPRQGCERDGDG
jgi:alpha-1,6-mannosyltransferase